MFRVSVVDCSYPDEAPYEFLCGRWEPAREEVVGSYAAFFADWFVSYARKQGWWFWGREDQRRAQNYEFSENLKQIQAESGLNYATAYSATTQLIKQGKVKKIGSGRGVTYERSMRS